MSDEKFIDTQKQSHDIFSKIHELQFNAGVAATAEIDELRRQYIERAQRRIDLYRTNEREHMFEVMREIDDNRIKQLKRIKTEFDNNSEKWIDDIFESIISNN